MEDRLVKILVVDDNQDNIVVLKALIVEAFPDIDLVSANSGRQAIELCHTGKPDVVILDILMPVMDGYEVCRKLKSDTRLKDIPVVMLTAKIKGKESRVLALEAGADGFLQKPVDESELKAQIKAMLKIKQSADRKKQEKQQLEDLILDRTESLEMELADRKKAEETLVKSLDKLSKNRKAILNLMLDLKTEIGERKKVEENLQKERNMLRTLIDNLPDTFYAMDKYGRKIMANKADIDIVGCNSEEEILGKTDLEVYPGEKGKRFFADSMNVIKSGIPKIDAEEKFIDKNGNVRYLNTTQYPLRDINGEIIGLVGIGHDITERKRSEQELEIKNKELGFLNETALEISQLKHEDNINEFIAKKLKDFSGAVIAVSLDYNQKSSTLQIKHIESKRSFLNKIVNTLGREFFDSEIPVNEDSLRYILTEFYAESDSLSELSFGQVSEFANKTLKTVAGIHNFFAVANVIGGEYFGTTILGLSKETVAPRRELLISFARVVAITLKRRRSEEKLKESEERYRLLIDNQGEGVAVVDLEEKFTFSNNAANEMFGVGEEGLVNKSLLDFTPSDQAQIIKNETAKRNNNERSSYEVGIIRPDGQRRTVLITATPQFDKQGKLIGTFGVFRDITERKAMEDKIIESEAYYRTLIDISPDGIITCDMEGNLTYASKKAFEIFREDFNVDFREKSVLSWIHPDNHQMIIDRIADILSGNIAPSTREYRLIRSDGFPFWGELSASPLLDKAGNATGLLVVCRDVSERKKAEEDILKARDKAQESDRLKTAFLHNISHEIRTPMNAIIGFTSLLIEPDLDFESKKNFIEVINQSSNHLLSVVNDIIEVSNIEAGLTKINKSDVNIKTTLNTLYTQFKSLAEAKGLSFSLEYKVPENVTEFFTDEIKLVQVISNLITNAFKFTSEGKIEIGCGLKHDNLEFYVSDTGIGIPKDKYDKVFDRFYQVESSISRQYEGTGLGLSICKAYVGLLGGEIYVVSEVGKGSKFTFTIPFINVTPPERKSDIITVNEVVINTMKVNDDKRPILIAEDEENNYLLIVELLASLDRELIHAWNGREALDICESVENIGLVLMDIKMPVMNGHESAREIRKKFPDLPVIALTAFAFESDRKEALANGCTDYISKPVKRSVLLETIGKYL